MNNIPMEILENLSADDRAELEAAVAAVWDLHAEYLAIKNPHSLSSVGYRMGLSKQAVQQTERHALAVLKNRDAIRELNPNHQPS